MITIQNTICINLQELIEFILNFGSLVILIFTLREMIRSRRESYRPKVFIKSRLIYLQQNNTSTSYIWKNDSNDTYEKNPYQNDNEYYLELVNAGLGAALNITIQFEKDYSILISEFKKLLQQYPDSIEMGNNEVRIKSQFGSSKYSFCTDDELFSYNRKSLLPLTSSDDIFQIPIPRSILLLLSSLIYFNRPLSKKIILPSLKLIISYDDIGGKRDKLETRIVLNYTDYEGGLLVSETGEYKKNTNICVIELFQR